MIALLLAAQLSATALPKGLVETIPPPRAFTPPGRPAEFVRPFPRKACGAELGKLEVSTALPTALYRKGDRPAKGLREWTDYPDGGLCLVEAAR